jgi:hypothetical protein
MRATLLFAALLLAGAACTTTSTVIENTIRPRAAYDLECPIEQVDVALISGGALEGSYGAKGCGRRVRYEAMCAPAASHCDVILDRNAE